MIYCKNYNKFDDSIIRATDSVINSVYYRQENLEYRENLPRDGYLKEFRTVSLSLPRRCGKTTYLAKLAKHFKRRGKSVIVFTPNLSMARREPWSEMETMNVMSYETFKKSVSYHLGISTSISADVILYDEVFDFGHYGADFTVSLHTRI